MTIQNTGSSWEQLLEVARNNTSARGVRKPGQSPSTACIPSSLHKLLTDTAPPVVLGRDTNSWCPFCECVWFALEEKEIPFATEFIDLFNKPKWYIDLVPTALVPAAKIDSPFVYKSKDILLALEERFGATLLPDNSEENVIANLLPPEPAISHMLDYRAEAAERFCDNHDVAITDILKNFGLQAFSGETSAIKSAINMHLRVLATY